MPRIVTLGVVAIAVFFAASVAAVLWVTREAPETVAVVADGPAPDRSPSPGGVAGPPIVETPGPVARPTMMPESMNGVPIRRREDGTVADGVSRASEVGYRSFRRAMNLGIAEFQKRVEPCGLQDAALTLTLETMSKGVRVADVQVERRGTSSDAAIACAVAALRGHVIRADSAEPGRSWQVPLAVPPRG